MDGILIINKPKGCTSHDIVYRIKKKFNKKVGHTGTLDPMAEGVLPILIGKGTLCSKYLINHNKKYQVILKLGQKTDTADLEGKVIEEKETKKENVTIKNVENVLKTFLGKQKQIPPIYSAIKINGKKLYEYARKGQSIEISPREIEIYDIKLLNIENDKIEFTVECSKGTYIRTLCEDIANKLETVGCMFSLKRLQVGDFKIEDSYTIEEVEQNKNIKIITLEELFKNNKKIILEANKLKHFLNGVKITINDKNDIYRIYDKNNNFIGTGILKNSLLKRDIVI